MAVAGVIPVARIREALERPQTYTPNAVRAMLPASGCVLSTEEVAEVRAALRLGWHATDTIARGNLIDAALALLDGADEEEP